MVAYNLESPIEEQEYIAEIRRYANKLYDDTLEAAGPAYIVAGKQRADEEAKRWLDQFSRSNRHPARANAARLRTARDLFLDVFADQWDTRRLDVNDEG